MNKGFVICILAFALCSVQAQLSRKTTTTTVNPKTTTTPAITTTSAEPPSEGLVEIVDNYKDGASALHVIFKAHVDIQYEMTDKSNSTAHVNIPEHARVFADTKCAVCQTWDACVSWQASTQDKGNWTLDLQFSVDIATDGKVTNTTDFCNNTENRKLEYQYSIHYLKLTYYIDNELFPNASAVTPEPIEKRNAKPLSLFTTESARSYQCNSAQNIAIISDPELSVTFSDFQAQAFYFNDEGYIFDSPIQCDVDEDNGSSLVPIIVGAVLAGLIVITLIGYFIGRWRQNKKSGYEQL